MFAYIFFLRPPPAQVFRNEPLLLSLQVANDLRTECSPVPVDIYLCWTRDGELIGPRKLATWSEHSQYKPISVPHPPVLGAPTAKPTSLPQKWRLVLTAAPTSHSQQVTGTDLSATSFSWSRPIPVVSDWITFHGTTKNTRDKTDPQKQAEFERRYRLTPDLRLTLSENGSFDLDKKIWDSGLGVSQFLCRLLCEPEDSSEIKSRIKSVLQREQLNIIELGAGTGLVSLVLSVLLGPHSEGRERTIWATDLPSAMDLMSRNFARNSAMLSSVHLKEAVLDWFEEALPEPISSRVSGEGALPFDLILMSDVTYNSSAFPALLKTIGKLLSRERKTHILLGYKKRDEGEDIIWELFQGQGIEFELVEEINGTGGMPVTIWWASITKPQRRGAASPTTN